MATEFYKMNQGGEIPIETVPDEHDETRDYEPSFWWDNRRHFHFFYITKFPSLNISTSSPSSFIPVTLIFSVPNMKSQWFMD